MIPSVPTSLQPVQRKLRRLTILVMMRALHNSLGPDFAKRF